MSSTIKNYRRTIVKSILVFCLVLWLNINPLTAQKSIKLNFNFHTTNSTEIVKTSLAPGEKQDFSLEVVNLSGQEPLRLKLYATDAISSDNGSISYKMFDQTQYQLGEWINLSQSEITIAGGEKAIIGYTISIPTHAPPGNYAGAIMGEIINTENNTDAVKIQVRKSLPIQLQIPGETVTKYQLLDFSKQKTANDNYFQVIINNSGNTFLKAKGKISITGNTLSKFEESIPFDNQILLQQQEFRKNFPWQPPLIGSFEAKLDLNIYRYDIVKDQEFLLETITETVKFTTFPYTIVFSLFCALLIFLICIKFYQKKHRAYLSSLRTYQVKTGDSIKSIADQFQLNWRRIAKLNRLKKPYGLKVGKELKLPRK